MPTRDNDSKPPNEVLVPKLHEYAREGLPLLKRVERLREELGYAIGLTTLKSLNKKHDVPSARNAPSREVATRLIYEKMAQDPNGRHGPVAIKKLLAQDGHVIPRDLVREVMFAKDPWGFVHRSPGPRTREGRGWVRTTSSELPQSMDV